MYLLYTWCTRECCNRLGRTPICRDSMVNHMFRNTFPMHYYCIILLSQETRGKVYVISFGMYLLYTWCTRECCNRIGRTPIFKLLCLIIILCSEYYAVVTHRKCIAKHIINLRIYADWSTTTSSSCTPRVQEVHSKAEVVHLSPVLQGLGILFNF